MKRRNSINEFSFHLTTLPTHYCPSDSGSIYNTMADSEPICYLRPIEQDSCSSRNVPDGVCNITRATPPQSPPPATKRFPSRSLSDSVLVIKEKQKSTIIPSWKPQTSDEKPPYSYATLIAYAILTSPERKLPLSDIYMTIASHFPYYVLGDNGWQNSIRHNLSLNKSFIKLDRKPSDARPGKGSYWTIVEGHEQTFIDSLTRPGGPLRKQTVNVGKRTMASHINSTRHQHANCENLLIMGPQDFENCSKPTHSITTSLTSFEPVSLPISLTQRSHQPAPTSSSMITIFRMAPMVNDGYRPGGKKRDSTSRKRRRTRPEHEHEHEHDSDCDSGVDVGNEFVPSKLFKKKAAAAPHHQTMHHDDDDPTLAQTPYLLDYTVAENISYSPTLSSLLDESSSPAPTSAFSTFPVDCEFEENLLLTQSSSLYSQEDTCWTTDYLTW